MFVVQCFLNVFQYMGNRNRTWVYKIKNITHVKKSFWDKNHFAFTKYFGNKLSVNGQWKNDYPVCLQTKYKTNDETAILHRVVSSAAGLLSYSFFFFFIKFRVYRQRENDVHVKTKQFEDIEVKKIIMNAIWNRHSPDEHPICTRGTL